MKGRPTDPSSAHQETVNFSCRLLARESAVLYIGDIRFVIIYINNKTVNEVSIGRIGYPFWRASAKNKTGPHEHQRSGTRFTSLPTCTFQIESLISSSNLIVLDSSPLICSSLFCSTTSQTKEVRIGPLLVSGAEPCCSFFQKVSSRD